MAILAVIVASSFLLLTTAHAFEPIHPAELAQQTSVLDDHEDHGDKSGGLHGCAAHCHGHGFAAPPPTTSLSEPVIQRSTWMPNAQRFLPAAPLFGLERPPRV
ncbi:MAG: hypothetical protein KAY22_02880 [Rhizorhabdus sp.]|uniref:hypothetical protein n=1 Tax=Rhizorhabdus sp. TaxID=1968843 RepID=UPI001B7498E3|nr:hypothetical protein [Rhizorhabdus sp.]MBP8231225.1 hypothetical protein [Rhizorhabdus sp.]